MSSQLVNPELKTVLFTPSVTTGREKVYNAAGQLDLVQSTVDLLQTENMHSGYEPDGWGVPTCLMGPPGIGKTSEAKAVCAALGLACVTSIASTKDPTDYNGIPVMSKDKLDNPNGKIKTYKGGEVVFATGHEPVLDIDGSIVKENGKTLLRKRGEVFTAQRGEPKYDNDGNIRRKKQVVLVADTAVPRLYIELAKIKNAVLFLDELTTAPPAVQAALLRLCLDKKVGEFSLPPGIRIIAAANNTEDAANGSDIAMPLANRFAWFNWVPPNLESWSQWLISGQQAISTNFSVEQEQKRVLSLWADTSSRVKGEVCGFLNSHSAMLFKLPNKNSTEASMAFPTPRSWHMAVNLLTSARIQGLNISQQEKIVASVIGHAACCELFTYIREADLPNPIDILDGRIEFTHNPLRQDKTFATISSMLSVMTSPVDHKDPKASSVYLSRLNIMWEILYKLHTVAPDLVLRPTSILLKRGGGLNNETRITFLTSQGVTPKALELSRSLQDLFTTSGVNLSNI